MAKRDTCYICGQYKYLEEHHLIGGNKRKLADKYGLTILVCSDCHTQKPDAIHRNPELQKALKKLGQQMFEEKHGTREDFMRIFGKSYL